MISYIDDRELYFWYIARVLQNKWVQRDGSDGTIAFGNRVDGGVGPDRAEDHRLASGEADHTAYDSETPKSKYQNRGRSKKKWL